MLNNGHALVGNDADYSKLHKLLNKYKIMFLFRVDGNQMPLKYLALATTFLNKKNRYL